MFKSPLSIADFPEGFEARLADNLQSCRQRIAAAAQHAGRDEKEITLLTVTKYVDSEVMRVLYNLGARDFGENRSAEAIEKCRALSDLEEARIHFIGHLQRNKARQTIEHCCSLHSLDSRRLLLETEKRLEDPAAATTEIYIEINLAGEDSKTGLPAHDLPALFENISECRNVKKRLRGLMTIPPFSSDPEKSRPFFAKLRELRDQFISSEHLPPAAGLSMGMSSDYEIAIEEGATVVRVGSAIYNQD